ncbi:MAG TPA: ABC transporter ATP-binding protein [Gammaproteobacteria bacterium]|nr:ABC transporter ATP-binding protein [Gammaproteobacteria bacterium]
MSPVIRLQGVSFSYGGPRVLDDVTLEVTRGEFLGVIGPNGSGKSTLLRLILGLIRPDTGQITVLGRPPKAARRAVGYVPQFTTFARDFPISVEGTVLMGRLGRTRWLGGYSASDRSRARRAMQETEIGSLAARPLASLSGGQLQRVLIARALACDPEILLLDEPTANVDLGAERTLFDLLRSFNRRMTIVVVSHDVGFISEYVERVACLNRTLVCHRTAELTGEAIQELYGRPVHLIRHDLGAGESP